MAVLPCAKPTPYTIPFPRTKPNRAFIGFTRVENQGARIDIQRNSQICHGGTEPQKRKIVAKHLNNRTYRSRRLRESICRKRPQFWQWDDWYFLHDNAPAN
ncbi:hypothetical protein TNCV_4081171 [Trichonephila clavipes]|nr:hypothetical protein TNCV_4081171 [Trichonephila clavipes]